MGHDLPNTKFLATDTLCDYESYLSKEQASELPRARAVVYTLALLACDLALIALLLLSIAAVASGSFNPFIYFRF